MENTSDPRDDPIRRDDPTSDCGPRTSRQPSSWADRHPARLTRITDYLADALEKEDALGTNLGSINSGLMRLALWLEETIEQDIENGPPNPERIERILPALETQLRLTRQIDRFAQLELRTTTAPRPETGKPRRVPPPATPSLPQSHKSEDSEI